MGDLPGSNPGVCKQGIQGIQVWPTIGTKLQLLQVHVNKPALAGQCEVMITTILVLPARCPTGGIGLYLRMQSTYFHQFLCLKDILIMANGYQDWRK